MWVDCRVLHGVCFINRGLVQLRRRKRKEGRKEGKKRWGEERLISFLKLGYDLSGFRLPLRIRIEVRRYYFKDISSIRSGGKFVSKI